jgi:hypothetical protein
MEEFAIRKPRRGSMRAALNKTKKGTPSEQAAIKLGKKAAKKALEEGSTPAQAKAIGKKLSMSQMDTNRSKTNVEALWLAASAVPIGGAVAKGAQAVKALGNLGAKKAIRKKAAKAMEGTPSKSKTSFRSRKGNENKSQEALKSKPKPPIKKTSPSSTQTIKQRAEKAMEGTPSKSKTSFRSRKGNENKSQKALKSKPKTTPKADLTAGQKKTVRRAKIIGRTGLGVGVGTGLAIGDLLTSDISKKPTGKMSASEARKLDAKTADEVGSRKMKSTSVKKPKDTLQDFIDEPSAASDNYTPPKKRGKYEGGIDYYDTPFGRIKADSSDEAFNFDVQEKDGGYLKKDMMKKRKHGGFLGKGAGKAQKGY